MTGATRKGAGRWIALLGLTFVVALGVALLVLMLYRPAQQPLEMGGGAAPVGLHVSLAESVTAQSVYLSAMDVAQSWQPDGQLAIVSARWRPRRGRVPSDVTWMFPEPLIVARSSLASSCETEIFPLPLILVFR